MDAKMKFLPYQFVAVISLTTAFFIGALLNTGADILKQQAQIDMLLSIPVSALSEVDTSEFTI
jgi:ABC-type enterobactin transport system permease subunit